MSFLTRAPKSRNRATAVMAAVALVFIAGCSTDGAASGDAARDASKVDLVFHNGTVIPLSEDDEGLTSYEAIAIEDGVVRKLGDTDEIMELVGDSTQVIDLAGDTVIPGINDSHFHITSYAESRPPLTLDVSKDNVSSIDDIRKLVENAVQDAEPGEWIRGRGWDQGYLDEKRFPTKEDLDDISPDNPVILNEWSGHALLANSVALEAADITSDTVAPPGGEIFKDANGEPTGVLTEGAARLMRQSVPDFTDEQRRDAIIRAVDTMHSLGITSVTDAGIDIETAELYKNLLEEGSIRQRITGMIGATSSKELPGILDEAQDLETDPKWLNLNQVKIFYDGVPTQQKTALVEDEYHGGGHGGLTVEGDTLEEQIAELKAMTMISHQEGFSVGSHATGDKAIDIAVSSFEEAVAEHGNDEDLRHYIIHGTLVTQEALDKLADLDLGINFNPTIAASLAHQLDEVLDQERIDFQWPYRSAIEAGIHVASGSDAPVVPPPPLAGIESMMTRQSHATGEVFAEDQKIDLEEALKTYTSAGAYQDHAEDWKGTLEEGMVGDLVVLEGNLTETPPEEIGEMNVQMTVVGGEIVYENE